MSSFLQVWNRVENQIFNQLHNGIHLLGLAQHILVGHGLLFFVSSALHNGLRCLHIHICKQCISKNKRKLYIRLTLRQQECEVWGSTYMQIFFDGVQSCQRIFSGDFNNFFFSSLLYFENTASNTY